LEAIIIFHNTYKVKNGNLLRIGFQQEKLTKQIFMVPFLSKAETVDNQAQAKRQVSQKKVESGKEAEKAKQINKI